MRSVPRLIAGALAAGLLALPSSAPAQKLVGAAGSLVRHDANRVGLRVSNRGGIGLAVQDLDLGNFPLGSPNRYLFGSGLWVGGFGDVDADGDTEPIVSVGFNPSSISEIEWIEGALGFSRDDPLFRVLDSTEPADADDYPATPVADQELFTMYGDRFSVFFNGVPSIPLGIEVRQRSFAFDEPGLDAAIVFQWDLLNISGRIRDVGYTIEDLVTGIVLDPDIGGVPDDTAAPLSIDGEEVLLVWDADFFEPLFDDRPGFLAVVPLVNPGGQTTVTQLTSGNAPGVLPVPTSDATRYAAMTGIPPFVPTIVDPGFDLRALVAWGPTDLAQDAIFRTAAAFVWGAVAGEAPDFLSPLDPELDEDLPALAELVANVRAVRAAYAERLADLPVLLDFPGDPPEPTEPGETSVVLQNFPNPFLDATTIVYQVAVAGDVDLRVYDLAGREVATLASGFREASEFTVEWDGQASSGIEMPAGVYVVRLEAPDATSAIRVLKSR